MSAVPDPDPLSFRPLATEDFPMLLEWLGRPHVKEWWDEGEDTLEKVAVAYGPEPDVERFILLIDGRPSGYFQYYRTDTPGHFGIDQFLSQHADLNHGIGRRAVTAFIAHICTLEPVERIIVDPDPRNVRAIRCYEHAGFEHTETRSGWNGAMAYYMERTLMYPPGAG